MVSKVLGLEYEYQEAIERAGWADLEIGILRVSGRDAARWLHKLITADVEHLAAGQGVRGALLEAKGHVIAELGALALQDSILLLVQPESKEVLLGSLKRYIFREKVQLADETADWSLFTIVGRQSDEVVTRIFHQRAPETPAHFTQAEFGQAKAILIRSWRAHVPATDVLVPASAREGVREALENTPRLAPETLEVLALEAGQPRWGVDFDSTTLALEIPEVMSIRVDQGCYVGQEVVARIVHRGHVNRRLVGLAFDAPELPARGAAIFHEGQEVGQITSAARSPRAGALALGYVRREFSAPGTLLQVGAHLRAGVIRLPFEE